VLERAKYSLTCALSASGKSRLVGLPEKKLVGSKADNNSGNQHAYTKKEKRSPRKEATHASVRKKNYGTGNKPGDDDGVAEPCLDLVGWFQVRSLIVASNVI
jgi:hypothetical protein